MPWSTLLILVCLLYVKHDEGFEILRNWQNVSLYAYDPVQ